MNPRSINADYPVDPVIVDILRSVADEAQAEQIDHMLVGATARDILLTHVFGLAPRRATYDVDFAVAVRDWHQFDALRNRLVARGTFHTGHGEFPIDLVPFGGVSKGTNEIAWPPDMKVIMNVAGYDDVLDAAELVALTPDFDAKVVSLAGLAILKLVAWSDRGRANPKDAHDLMHLMSSYAAAGNLDRVYAADDAIEAGGYDPDLAGVYLLGKDMRLASSEQTREVLMHILARDVERLSIEMIRAVRYFDDAEQRVASSLRLLQDGLTTG